MPIDFEQILKDDKTYPDTMELTVGDQKVPLGAMRNLTKRQQQQLSEQLEVVQKEREAAAARHQAANEMTEKATAIYNNLQQQLEATKDEQSRAQARTQTGGYDPEQEYQNGVWFGPIRKRDQAHQETINKIMDQLNLLSNTVGAMGRVYTEDRLTNEYESTAEARRKSKALSDWDLPKLRKYAEDNKIQDRLGFASIREAVNRLTESERKQEEAQASYERGLREGEMRARMGVMPRPAAANAAVPGGQTPPKSLDEALSPESVYQDEELSQMLAELQNQGANFIGNK